MGFKTFAVGEVLTADDVMTYLMKQVVIVCTSSTRPTATEGMVIYETDTDRLKVNNGTTWVDIAKSDVANTFAAKLAITGGGLDLDGTPSGYLGGEVRFTNTGNNAQAAISTLGTGSPTMLFDHRAASNAGGWKWRNGSSAANEQMTLSAAGHLAVPGGFDVDGSPSGYLGGEVRFTNGGADAQQAISSLGTGAPSMRFDHRGASNTGGWKWRNGTAAANERMSLGATGDLATSGKINATTTGGNAVAFADNDSNSWESDGGGGWRFRNASAGAGATFRFLGGAGTTEQLRIEEPTASGDTALQVNWISPTGTTRFKTVRVSAVGEVDGTSRRYLYVVDV
jgi:hypothetical protein